MKKQKVKIEFADIRLFIAGNLEMQLLPLLKTVSSIGPLKNEVETYLEKFLDDIGNAVSVVVHIGSDVVSVKEIQLVVGGETKLHYAGCVDADSGVWLQNFGAQAPGREIKRATSIAVEDYGVVLTFEGNNIALRCKILCRWSRGWSLLLSENMLNYELGKEVRIKYGSSLHKALWEIRGDWCVGAREVICETLRNLNLIHTSGYRLTVKGEQVLAQLDEMDPSSLPGFKKQFSDALTSSRVPYGPVYTFAVLNGYLDTRYRERTPTEKGRQWLVSNCDYILDHSKDLRVHKRMIPYMSAERLPEYLTSKDEELREEAKCRAKNLGI